MERSTAVNRFSLFELVLTELNFAGPSMQGSHSAGALPRDSPQELLLGEIRRLRERLVTLESENATMSMKLSQQQWEVEHRLHEIELQLCGNSSNASSNDDIERNRESII